jgi:hypothetical protein
MVEGDAAADARARMDVDAERVRHAALQHPSDQPALCLVGAPEQVGDARTLDGLEALEEEKNRELAVGSRVDLHVAHKVAGRRVQDLWVLGERVREDRLEVLCRHALPSELSGEVAAQRATEGVVREHASLEQLLEIRRVLVR